MPHIEQRVYARHKFYMCLVVHEVRVCFDGCGYFFKFVSVFQLDVHHAAVDSRSGRNGHGEGGFHSVDCFNGNCVSHAHAWAEVGVSDSFRSDCFEHGAYDRVASRVPSCGDDRYGFVLLGGCIQRAAQVDDACVDIEAVYRINSHCQVFFGVFLNAAGRRAEDGYFYFFQFLDIFHYCIVCQLFRFVLCSCTTNDSGDFEIRRCLQRFKYIVSDIAVTDNSCSYFFHSFIGFI